MWGKNLKSDRQNSFLGERWDFILFFDHVKFFLAQNLLKGR